MDAVEREAYEHVVELISAGFAKKLDNDDGPMELVAQEMDQVSFRVFRKMLSVMALSTFWAVKTVADTLGQDPRVLWQEITLKIAKGLEEGEELF